MYKQKNIKKFKEAFIILKRTYGNSYAWTEVMEVLSSEGQDLNIGEEDIHDPFKNLIIGILSQNTSDRNCTRAYIGLVKKTEITPLALFSLSEVEIRDAIKAGGLYNLKAKRIKELTKAVIEKYNGDTSSIMMLHNPEKTRDNLLQLPGIGPKTADVFLTECMDYGVMAVDTNINRVVKRIGFVLPNAGYYEIKNALEQEVPPEERLRAHELLIRLGRDYCKFAKPLCKDCPLDKLCKRNLI